MLLSTSECNAVPVSTAELVHKAFPNGHAYITLRDQLGAVYTDAQFTALFTSQRGRPAESPGRLALVLVLELLEDVSEATAADFVRSRLDWKYLLGLEPDDPGFDASVLTEFRQRLIAGHAESLLLETVLAHCERLGLLKKRGTQRTDATHMLAACAHLNRLELVGETLRFALESLATVAPTWLQEHVPAAWYERYGHRFAQGPQPHQEAERLALAQQIAADGALVLAWCSAANAPAWLSEVPALATLRLVWEQQFCLEGAQWRWRTESEMPPHTERIVSPYDVEARYGRKRETEWCGYKTHLTETCDADLPRLITHVETTNAALPDRHALPAIHEDLAAHDRLPACHLVDSGYVDAGELVAAQAEYAMNLLGPVPEDHAWQAQANAGYASSQFSIDWEAQQVTCPQGQRSHNWHVGQDAYGEALIQVRFAASSCGSCPVHEQCTHSAARALSFRPRPQQEALQRRRAEQQTLDFKEAYQARAGIEGTISQGVRSCGLRHARYRGQAKSHLQNILTAVALNLSRLADWGEGLQPRRTRISRFVALAPI